MEKINVAIVDDHELVTNTLSYCLSVTDHFEVVLTANSGQELLNTIESDKKKIDVILMDIQMPDFDGFEVTEAVLKILPNCKILFLTFFDSEAHVFKAIRCGGHGYVLKNGSLNRLQEAIRSVYANDFYFNEQISEETLQQAQQETKSSKYPDNHDFTKRELEYIRLLCEAKTDHEIADQMCIEVSTAETYRKNIMKKTGTKKAIGIVVYALKNKLLDF